MALKSRHLQPVGRWARRPIGGAERSPCRPGRCEATASGDADGSSDEVKQRRNQQQQQEEDVAITYRGRALRAPRGAKLRTALLQAGVSPHNGRATLINCRGLGTCGTCAVEIRWTFTNNVFLFGSGGRERAEAAGWAALGRRRERPLAFAPPLHLLAAHARRGEVEPAAWTAAERLRLNFPPHGPPGNEKLRLACQAGPRGARLSRRATTHAAIKHAARHACRAAGRSAAALLRPRRVAGGWARACSRRPCRGLVSARAGQAPRLKLTYPPARTAGVVPGRLGGH